MVEGERNDMKSSTAEKVWSFGWDKKYFVGLWIDVKKNLKQSLVTFIGLTYLLTLTLLYLEVKAVDVKVWGASVVVVVVVMTVLLRPRIRRKVVRHNFDPVSLGTLWFSFALSLWISQPIREWYIIFIEICFSLGALAFLVAVFSRSMRMFINTEVASEVMLFTLLAFVFGFTLGWLPAITQVSGIIREVILYFGFLWVVVMLVVMFRDAKNELAHILFVVFFIMAALIKLWKLDTIGIIGGVTLLGIAALLYLVATHRVHPYGEVSEK